MTAPTSVPGDGNGNGSPGSRAATTPPFSRTLTRPFRTSNTARLIGVAQVDDDRTPGAQADKKSASLWYNQTPATTRAANISVAVAFIKGLRCEEPAMSSRLAGQKKKSHARFVGTTIYLRLRARNRVNGNITGKKRADRA